MADYNLIFNEIESTLIRIGEKNLPVDQIRSNLNPFKYLEGKTFTDSEYYWIIVYVIFYSGFRAATVTAKLDLIRKYLHDFVKVSTYDDTQINEILNDPEMIKNSRKILACVKNARTFMTIVSEYGSFQKFVDSYAPRESFENLMLLKEDLEYRFEGLGKVTTYHVLTDIGMPVIKPDRVICRIFQRLGLIDNEGQLLKTVIQGRKFAQATRHPIRYIDIVFVAYGQMESREFGITRGICLEESPSCLLCGVKSYCNYYAGKYATSK